MINEHSQAVSAEAIFSGDFNIFDSVLEITPSTVRQGSLGDCYLISSISALAQRPEFIKRLFLQQNKNEVGLYGVWIFESGEWRQVLLDDNFVVQMTNNKPYPLYAKPAGNGIWVQLLEKAYAKIYGGFRQIEVGRTCDSMRDLTGCPTENIEVQKDYSRSFALVISSLRENFVLTASSSETSQDMQSRHSYSVIDAKIMKDSKGKIVRLLKIRNPLGFNFKAPPSQGFLDTKIQNRLGEETRQENGVLWMNESEVIENFEVLTVCHTKSDYVSGSYQVNGKTIEFFYMQNLHPENNCYFSIIQKHERYQRQNGKDEWFGNENKGKQMYKTARIIVAKISPETGEIVRVIGGTFGSRQQCFFEEKNLGVGEYLIFCEVDAKAPPMFDTFVFQTYSKFAVSITPASDRLAFKKQKEDIINVMFSKYIEQLRKEAIKSEDSQKQPEVKKYDNTKGKGLVERYFSSLFGFAFIYYTNESDSSFTEKVEVINHKNIDLMDLNRKERQDVCEVNIQPGEKRLILFRILEYNACSHALNFKGTWFFGSGFVKKALPTQVQRNTKSNVPITMKYPNTIINVQKGSQIVQQSQSGTSSQPAANRGSITSTRVQAIESSKINSNSQAQKVNSISSKVVFKRQGAPAPVPAQKQQLQNNIPEIASKVKGMADLYSMF